MYFYFGIHEKMCINNFYLCTRYVNNLAKAETKHV